jgi:hypothetical protein
MIRSSTARAFVVAAFLACAAALGASGQEPERLQRARAGLPRHAAARLDQLLQAASTRGLPTSPLVDKVLEGEAKQAPPERILAVVGQLSDNHGRARALRQTGGAPGADDLTAVADALRRGVPEAAVRTLHARRPDRPIALAVVTLADLVQEGVPVQHALQLLQAWADRGGRQSELRDLPASVERLMHQGTLPAQAAEAVEHALKGGGAEDLASDRGKSGSDHGRGGDKPDRPPVPPGAGPPSGKDGSGSHKGHD